MSNSRLANVTKTTFIGNPNFQIPKSGGLVCLKKTWDEKRRRGSGVVLGRASGGGGWSLLPIWPRSVREKVWCSIHMRSWPGARATVGRQTLLKRLSYALHDHSGCVSRYRQKDDREKRSEALTLNLQRTLRDRIVPNEMYLCIVLKIVG